MENGVVGETRNSLSTRINDNQSSTKSPDNLLLTNSHKLSVEIYIYTPEPIIQ